MNIDANDLESLNTAASYVRFASGASHAEAVRRVKEARDNYEIDLKTYVRDRLYLLPTAALPALKKHDRFVSLVAKKKAIPYARAFSIMYDIRSRYGIGFREFAQQKLYSYSNDEALNRAVRRLIEREGKHIRQVCHETGWSVEEAETRMRETKAKFPTIDFRKYAGYGFFSQTEDQIAERVRTWNTAATENRRVVAEATGWPVQKVREHMTRFQVLYDIIPAYYMCYRGWELSDEQIDGYARMKLSERLSGKYNLREDTDLLGQKDQFDRIYNEFIHRKFWVNVKGSTLDEFLEFAEGLDEAFCKPLRSGGGLGTFKVDLSGDRDSLRAAFESLMAKSLVLVEESVKQHEEINAFYPHSVNTVRVVTLQDDNGVHIISTGIRFGTQSITDNFSADGMVSDVDIDTGLITTPAVDKKGLVYEAHPHSGKHFVGFKVPHWDLVIDTAKRAMEVLPGVNYVGWDMAIGPEVVSIIEGNSMPDLVLVQAPYAPTKVGKRYLFDPFLEGPAPSHLKNAKTQIKAAAPEEIAPIAASSDVRSTATTVEQQLESSDEGPTRIPQETVRAGEEGETIVDDGVQFSLSSEGAALTAYKGAAAELTIPSTVRGIPVVRIGQRAFAGNDSISTVFVPSTVREIGSSAFAACPNLVSVTIEEGTEIIGSSCFDGCETLSEVVLPESVRNIYRQAFKGCASLQEIELPDHVSVLNRSVFKDCVSLRTIGLPYGLERIGTSAFENCTSLETPYFYSKRGISDVMVTDRDLKEPTLPVLLEYIGPRAFRGCASLRRVDIPYRVREIHERSFSRCTSLTHVGLHNGIRKIDTRAFRGCTALKTLRLPQLCKNIGSEAFSPKTTLVSSKQSFAAEYSKREGQKWRPLSVKGSELTSEMHPGRGSKSSRPFYAEDQVDAACERYELRHPSYEKPQRDNEPEIGVVPPSRFKLVDGVYSGEAGQVGQARLMLVGDLMARFRQQQVAAEHNEFNFDFSFSYVAEMFQSADFVAGNLETMVSPSSPYTLESEHVNARPHLNAPASFLGAIRRAGFDCVTHAQNHVYDAGVRGVFETLSLTNQSQLMHTGAYVSREDTRFLVVDLGGIRVGLVAYLDSARQMMKKANFTKGGRETLFPYFEEESVRKDIGDAKAAGAEYVIAFCHWGREYTEEVTERQRGFALIVANAGADYIIGSHSHCIQPYERISADDGREVPCIWSAGNFISDINLKPPITRDTLIMDLTLSRDRDGEVKLHSESYHPCRIMNLRNGDHRDYAVVPTSTVLEGTQLNETLFEATRRIVSAVGSGIERARPVSE